MNFAKIFGIFFSLLFIIAPLNGHPHPGRTDSNGCHTCRTNCTERWGIPYGFYRRHHPVRPCFETPTPAPENAAFIESNLCNVIRVVDGDTFECSLSIDNKEIKRLIGVDTPETKHPTKAIEYYGKEAENFTRETLNSKPVRLELDVQQKDKYGRLLAYVYLEDGRMFNALLVQEGYAQVSTYPPNVKYQKLFSELQKEARENGKGLWGKWTGLKSIF